MVDIYDFIESADDALFCDFSECCEVNIISFSLVIGLGFICVKDVIIASWTEAFGVNISFLLASFTGFNLGLPFYFFITSVTEAFGVMIFFIITINTNLYHHSKKKAFAY
jgi:hypothetical protein